MKYHQPVFFSFCTDLTPFFFLLFVYIFNSGPMRWARDSYSADVSYISLIIHIQCERSRRDILDLLCNGSNSVAFFGEHSGKSTSQLTRWKFSWLKGVWGRLLGLQLTLAFWDKMWVAPHVWGQDWSFLSFIIEQTPLEVLIMVLFFSQHKMNRSTCSFCSFHAMI